MRSKAEIVSDAVYALESSLVHDDERATLLQRLVLEVLLDVRDLTDMRPAVRYPDSPLPPEVR